MSRLSPSLVQKLKREAEKRGLIQTTATKRITFEHLKIQTKDNRLVQFSPNTVQVQYLDALCPGWRNGMELRGMRELVLKARQFGFTTLIEAIFFLATVNTPNVTTLVVAHDADSTEIIFQMAHRFWQHLPPDLQPKTKYNSKRELYFNELNSRFRVMTAGAKGSGRGMTIHNLHASEAAFYVNPALLTGLLQTVPSSGNIFIESTANGESGDGEIYYGEYQKAKKLQSPFTARFYAWWQHEEYEREPPIGFARSPDETTLCQRLELDRLFGAERTNRKLYWRRVKMAEPGMGNLFAQEYPADDKEAFLVSGKRYFTEWDEDRHICSADVPIERHWQFFGGFDWGFGKPCCFLLCCIDERGRVIVLDEVYLTRKINPEQAKRVRECLLKWKLRPERVEIYADPAMWARKTDHTGEAVADVEAFHSAGLQYIEATNNRRHGWSNLRRYLHDVDSDGVAYLRVIGQNCPNLVRTIPLMIHDERDPEDMDTDLEDHAVDTLRYALARFLRPSGPDPNAPQEPDRSPSWLRRAKEKRKL